MESLIKASIHTSDFVNQNVANQNLTLKKPKIIVGVVVLCIARVVLLFQSIVALPEFRCSTFLELHFSAAKGNNF